MKNRIIKIVLLALSFYFTVVGIVVKPDDITTFFALSLPMIAMGFLGIYIGVTKLD